MLKRHSSIASGFGVREGVWFFAKNKKHGFPWQSSGRHSVLPMPGAQVRSPDQELRSDMSQDMA